MDYNIKKAIAAISENKLEEMKKGFEQALYNKSVDLLEEKKRVIASVYFGKK